MKKLSIGLALFLLVGCGETPTQPPAFTPDVSLGLLPNGLVEWNIQFQVPTRFYWVATSRWFEAGEVFTGTITFRPGPDRAGYSPCYGDFEPLSERHIHIPALGINSATAAASEEGQTWVNRNLCDPELEYMHTKVLAEETEIYISLRGVDLLEGDGLETDPVAENATYNYSFIKYQGRWIFPKILSFGPAPSDPNATPPGADVEVSPEDPTGGQPVELVFENVLEGGSTTLEITASGPPPPTGFKLGSPQMYFNLSTTAVFEGTVHMCIDYSAQTVRNPEKLALLHNDGGQWSDITTSHDLANQVICGETTSFSPFIVAEQVDPLSKDECKQGGWEEFGFMNQGQCVRFIETGKDSR